MKVLLTGFDPFGGENINPALEAVKLLPDNISDEQMTVLARDVSKRVENEMDYPGQIKVNVIRETRVVDYAK